MQQLPLHLQHVTLLTILIATQAGLKNFPETRSDRSRTGGPEIPDYSILSPCTATVKFDSTGLQYSITDMTFECLKSDYSIVGNDWASVNFSPVEQAFQFTDLTSLVDITFDTTLTYDLNDAVNLVINELVTGKFTYRKALHWLKGKPAKCGLFRVYSLNFRQSKNFGFSKK